MKNITIFYLLDKNGQKESILNEKDGHKIQVIITEATKEILDLDDIIITSEGDLYLMVGFYTSLNNLKYYLKNLKKETNKVNNEKHAFTPISGKEFFDNATANPHWYKYIKGYYYFSSVPLIEEIINGIKELNESYILKQKEELEVENAFKKEQKQWIEQYGSDYLKDCLLLGYECIDKYIDERKNREYPGYKIDFDNIAKWEDICQPSLKALREVKQLIYNDINAKIVLLCQDIEGYDDTTEAILIENYLNTSCNILKKIK